MRSKILRALGVAGLAVAGFANAGAVDIPDIPHEFYRLDNGLEVILHEDHSTPIAGVNIWYHVGSKNERPGRSGFAHLFEHMMFQGSAHQDREYFQPIQSVGGTLNGSTSEDRTNYWELIPANQLERVLILQADRMGFLLPAMTQEKLDNQRDVVRNERRQSEGRPYSAFWLNLNENFYPKGHPYDHSVIGLHGDLEAATLEDVKDFFRSYYTPNNATLSIAGDFDPAQVKAWVEKYFGPIPPGPPVEEVRAWVPEMTNEKRIHSEDDVQLTRLYYAWHTPPYYGDGDAEMSLAGTILGEGRISRLYRRLVHDEKLAQDVDAHQESQQISSIFLATITLRPGADAAAAERILDEEIARFASEGPTAEELQRAKAVYEAGFVKGIQRIGSWGGINDRLNRYNHYVGTPDWFRQDYERYMNATADGIREEFERWIGPGRLVYTIAPLGDLSADDVASVDYSTLPEGAAAEAMPIPVVHRGKLDNGLELVVLEQHELPLVRANLVFHSGTAQDPAGLAGLASVASAMLLEGTRHRDKFEFENALDALGTDFGVWVNDDYTTMWMLALRKNLDPSMHLMTEALLEPSFPADEFADQKERRLTDIRREKDSPHTLSAKATRRILYGDGHPYASLGTGTEASLEELRLADAREFAATHFTPGNATLVVVGDITMPEVEKMASRHLGKWSGAAPRDGDIPDPPVRSGRAVYLIDKPGDSQSTISIAHVGLARGDDAWEKVFVANRALGGMFTSRLNLNLREDKGYTYGVRSQTWEMTGPGLFDMTGRVQTEVTAPALVEFLKELEGMAGSKPLTAEELQVTKNSILLGYPGEFETIAQLADALTEQIVYGLPDDYFARYPEKIEAVDLATANAAAASYFRPDDVAVIVVGDLAKIEDSIRALDLGPIRHVDANGVVKDQELSIR